MSETKCSLRQWGAKAEPAERRRTRLQALKYGTRFGVTPEEESEVEVEQHMRAVEGLLRAGYLDQGYKRYKHLHETNRLRYRQYDKCMKWFGEIDSLGIAWSIYEEFCSEECREEPQLSSHNTIMGLCAEKKDTAKVRIAYERLVNSNNTPDLYSFKMYIATLVDAPETREVERAYGDMEQRGIKPDLGLMRMLMRMYDNKNKVSGVKAIYQRMLDAKIRPDQSTYNMYINAIGKHQSIEEAERAFELMDRSGSPRSKPDVVTYNTLIRLHARRGRLDRAKQYYQQMIGRGIAPTEVTFTILLNALCKEGDIASAKAAFGEMERRGVTPHVYHFNSLIELHLNRREHAQVYEQYLEIRRLGDRPDRHTYNLVMTSLVRDKKEAESIALFEEMQRMDVRADRNTYALLMRLYINSSRVEEAREWFKRMLMDGVSPGEVNFAILIEVHVKAGLLEEAERLVQDAKQRQINPRTRLHLAISRLAGALGDVDRARESIRQILASKGWRIEHADLEAAIHSMSMLRQHDLVLELDSEMLKRDWTPSFQTRKLISRAGRVGSSDNVDVEQQAQPFVEMIDRFARAKDVVRAKRAFNRMLTEDIAPTTEVYNALIRAYAIAGETNMARETLRELEMTQGLDVDAGSYRPIILALLRDRNVDEAKDVIRDARNRNVQVPLPTPQAKDTSS